MPALIQRVIAVGALVMLGPLILTLGLAVRMTSPGPAFHRAVRVRPGGTFTLFKLRTMGVGASRVGPGVTAGGDRRVTRLGRLLRRTKLDELPQLWNVVRGDMLLVGPRPEDPRYVDLSDPLHRTVFGAPPGITGAASVAYRDEERLLAGSDDVERTYREIVQPAKLRIDADYLAQRSVATDLRILLATVAHRPSRG